LIIASKAAHVQPDCCLPMPRSLKQIARLSEHRAIAVTVIGFISIEEQVTMIVSNNAWTSLKRFLDLCLKQRIPLVGWVGGKKVLKHDKICLEPKWPRTYLDMFQ